MSTPPTQQQLRDAIVSAGNAHHDYETNLLDGVRDEHWAGWYAAFVLGRLGEFTTPTSLTRWLAEVSEEGNWSDNAAKHVFSRIR